MEHLYGDQVMFKELLEMREEIFKLKNGDEETKEKNQERLEELERRSNDYEERLMKKLDNPDYRKYWTEKESWMKQEN